MNRRPCVVIECVLVVGEADNDLGGNPGSAGKCREKVSVFVKGIGSGRESAVRSLAAKGLEIISIVDLTPVPHNGCRAPKTRRV